ncbi:MBL fold metallo-hydrolase [Haloferax mediterranei ATCC 33500]|uniref:Flavoprotein n=1 Tax=Haloferax mediterranei (strain ATCC 33500 / DSM 1411 / JCM 8866 / NBRC 14739 / NCIMB 2177 / R-4) TaxID=523841 RepID=I3R8M2_HALMT|nr:MBL fold metallo-hydrolase [Haloferax mediterranei]AFK20582.1 hydroxyacylglutathione hydrolase [Haloferax mediterranei ATCC 33500]AHZ23938.1 flavoprotein [Haloferax mediterranei ATCC 33500]ELZ98365.1 hydroxyacylglutathione hydrolase [Haloferax mediterranei ATCC 33500]MDX5986662.1 MBL fold metallo-hydrolase [Haloferax mediterranei ATCC 33500]QCQ75994.1 MBL fold metallo-hydrolase [Haloferax mediterranei ATCC 33500]
MIRNLAKGVRTFTSNVFLVEGETTALVDTGANFDVIPSIREVTDDLDTIYITHTHPDHIGNTDAVREAFDVETWGYDADNLAVDNRIEDGERIQIGDDVYEAIHTPGHKNDHLCFFSQGSGICFAGDLVFANGGFGRTDLPEGDREALIESIDRLREAVGDDLREIHVGHGSSIVTRPQDDLELAARAARVNR